MLFLCSAKRRKKLTEKNGEQVKIVVIIIIKGLATLFIRRRNSRQTGMDQVD